MNPGVITVRARRSSLPLLAALAVAACSHVVKDSMALKPGATKAQVQAQLGTPVDRSFRGDDEAWQYQGVIAFGVCEYLTAWFAGDTLQAVTTRRAEVAGGCSSGSQPVDWGQFRPYPVEVKIGRSAE